MEHSVRDSHSVPVPLLLSVRGRSTPKQRLNAAAAAAAATAATAATAEAISEAEATEATRRCRRSMACAQLHTLIPAPLLPPIVPRSHAFSPRPLRAATQEQQGNQHSARPPTLSGPLQRALTLAPLLPRPRLVVVASVRGLRRRSSEPVQPQPSEPHPQLHPSEPHPQLHPSEPHPRPSEAQPHPQPSEAQALPRRSEAGGDMRPPQPPPSVSAERHSVSRLSSSRRSTT